MIKDILKEKEPIAYLSLINDFEKHYVSHSYLLTGEVNPLKLDTAFLIAQSIIEENFGLACETCNTCKRIKNGNYFDVIYIDGYKEMIKKEHIEKMMNQFSETALEEAGKKIYIISNINNSSDKVLNMILKFMEEPRNDTYGIFITDNQDTLLETIVSRCQKIPFKTRDFSNLINDYENNGLSFIDAYLLSNILHRFDEYINTNNKEYIIAKEIAYKTIDNLNNKEYLPVMFYKEYFNEFNYNEIKTTTDFYLDIMMKILEDAISFVNNKDEEYNDLLDKLRIYDLGLLLKIFSEAKLESKTNVDRKLLFDQIAYKIILYI